MDLVGDLVNNGLSDLTGAFLEEANRHIDVAITTRQLRRFRFQEWLTWRTLRLLLRVEHRWQQLVRGAPYPHLLPDDFNEGRAH